MSWYYARDDERMGPIDDEQFEELISRGAIRADTLVWREGMADWTPLASVQHTIAPEGPGSVFGVAAQRPCAECGRSFPVDELVAFEDVHVCAACKPFFFQRLRESGGVPGQLIYAGFWIRFAAWLVDAAILFVIGIPLSILQNQILLRRTNGTGGDVAEIVASLDIIVLFNVISLLIGLVYATLFVGRYAATPGKMLLGLKIVLSDGGRVSYPRAIGRYFATILSSMTLMIGYIIAAFDDQKRALHDHICDTRVVRK